MMLSVLPAQVDVAWDVDTNLSTVREVVASARPGDVVVLPEGMLSGYAEDLSPLDTMDGARVLGAAGATFVASANIAERVATR
jgi:predicted amidohydrolase